MKEATPRVRERNGLSGHTATLKATPASAPTPNRGLTYPSDEQGEGCD